MGPLDRCRPALVAILALPALLAAAGCSHSTAPEPGSPMPLDVELLWTSTGSLMDWRGSGGSPTNLCFGADGRIYLSFLDRSFAVQRGAEDMDMLIYAPLSREGETWTKPYSGDFDAIAAGRASFLYVVDRRNENVLRLGLDGTLAGSWGKQDAHAPLWFREVADVVVDEEGFIYVADLWNHRIQKLSPEGSYVTQWSTEREPAGIALDDAGFLYVTVLGVPGIILKFTTEGRRLDRFEAEGDFTGIDVDARGHIFVGSQYASRIREYSPSFDLHNEWTVREPVADVAVDDQGHVYALFFRNPSVVRLDDAGHEVASWDTGMPGFDYHWTFPAISVSPAGEVLVAFTGNRVRRYADDGTLLAEWGEPGADPGQFNQPRGVCTGPDGRIYVADGMNHRIQVFDEDGAFVEQIARKPTDGCFQAPVDLALDSEDNVYVADSGNFLMQKFDADGRYLARWGTKGDGAGEFRMIRGVAVDEADEVYVWDTQQERIQVFDSSGRFLRMWPVNGRHGTIDPWPNQTSYYLQSTDPHSVGMAAGPGRIIYLADKGHHRIVAFDKDGRVMGEWGGSGTEPGRFSNPRDVAVGPQGEVCVLDYSNGRLQAFRTPWSGSD